MRHRRVAADSYVPVAPPSLRQAICQANDEEYAMEAALLDEVETQTTEKVPARVSAYR